MSQSKSQEHKTQPKCDSADRQYPGSFKGALIYGKAELDYEDVVDKRMRIFQRRLSEEDARIYATRLSNKWQYVIIRITPVRIVSFDYSKG